MKTVFRLNKVVLLLAMVALFLVPTIASAEKTNFANTYPSLGRGVRPLGMGNAFLTMKGTDQNALFYNPAAIRDFPGDIKFTTSMLPAPPFEFNYSIIQLTKDIFDFQDDLDASTTSSGDIDLFRDFVDKHIGSFYSLELQTPIIGAYNRYFAVNLISNEKFGVSFRNRAFPNFEIRSTNVAGIAIGSAYGFLEERLEVGAAAKFLYGVENQQIITTTDILTDSFGDEFKWKSWKRGLGIGFDLGVKYEIHDFGQDWIDMLKPTIAIVYQNVGKTRFSFMKKNGGPEALPQSVGAGIGIHPTLGTIETSLCVDFRELNVKEDFLLKLNVGAEARFPSFGILKPYLRGGLNQGYPTVGAGLDIWKATWNVAFFGKEVGNTTHQKGGYRIANEFSWKF